MNSSVDYGSSPTPIKGITAPRSQSQAKIADYGSPARLPAIHRTLDGESRGSSVSAMKPLHPRALSVSGG